MTTAQGFWDNNDQTCYRIEFYDGWKWVDFKNIHVKSYAMLGQLERQIDLIVVFKGRVPRGNSLGYLSAGGDQPPNMRHTVMVNATDLATKMFIQAMVDTVVNLHDWVGPHFVDSLEEARAYLAKQTDESRQSLD